MTKKKKKKHILSCYVIINGTYLNLLYWILLNILYFLFNLHAVSNTHTHKTVVYFIHYCIPAPKTVSGTFFWCSLYTYWINYWIMITCSIIISYKSYPQKVRFVFFWTFSPIHTILLNVMLHSQKILSVHQRTWQHRKWEMNICDYVNNF